MTTTDEGTSERSEIAFFDLETAVPTQAGQGFAILEFGSILVCPSKLVELHSYSTLVRPSDLSLISSLSVRGNGISRDDVLSAPSFSDIAGKVYDLLHGRIWAGHNILRFDCARIREAFSEINRPAPEPKGIIDSLALLTQKFGRRAGDMKLATLANYFGLGQQTHRSLDDVRMNLEVLKSCATVLFLESSRPDIFTEKSWVSPNATTRSRSVGKASLEGMDPSRNTPSSNVNIKNHSSLSSHAIEVNHPILSLVTPIKGEVIGNQVECTTAQPDPFDMGLLIHEMERESRRFDASTDEESPLSSTASESYSESLDSSTVAESYSESLKSSSAAASEGFSGCANFLGPDEVSIPLISAVLAPFYYGTQRIQILHKNVKLQMSHSDLKVRFGISTKFVDYAGRQRLSFVVDAPPSLCQVLDACDDLSQRLSVDSGSLSEWRAVVTRKAGFLCYPTVRFHIPTVADGDGARWATEIYQKESSTVNKLVFSRFDVAELDGLIMPGNFVDAYFFLDTYDYQQNAGIRLVARKLIIQSN